MPYIADKVLQLELTESTEITSTYVHFTFEYLTQPLQMFVASSFHLFVLAVSATKIDAKPCFFFLNRDLCKYVNIIPSLLPNAMRVLCETSIMRLRYPVQHIDAIKGQHKYSIY